MQNFRRLAASALAGTLALATFGQAAQAADGAGNFSVRGIGGQGCSVWIQVLDQGDETQRREGILAFQSWLAGYITALNRTTAETYDGMPFLDMVNVLAIVVNECRAKPDALVEETAFRVVSAFTATRVQADSPLVTVMDAGVEKAYRQETIMVIQQKLIDGGYLDGAADGVPGDATFAALKTYQADAGLPATGELSVDTVFKLLLN